MAKLEVFQPFEYKIKKGDSNYLDLLEAVRFDNCLDIAGALLFSNNWFCNGDEASLIYSYRDNIILTCSKLMKYLPEELHVEKIDALDYFFNKQLELILFELGVRVKCIGNNTNEISIPVSRIRKVRDLYFGIMQAPRATKPRHKVKVKNKKI